MSTFCSFCCKAYTLRNLSNVSNIKLNVSIMLKDAFKLEIDINKFTEICKECEEKLEISWNFYTQVVRAQEIHHGCIVKEEIVNNSTSIEPEQKMTKVKDRKVKKVSNLETIAASSSSKISAEEFNSVVVKEEYESSCIYFSETFFLDEIETKVENLKPSKPAKKQQSKLKKPDSFCKRRSKSKGLKKEKSILCITMISEFEKEINRQKFFQAPEVLENLEENPRLWSDFDWKCTECEEAFDNLIEMNVHLQKSHRHKQYHGTCSQCLKETFRICTFQNHAIKEHHKNLKFCCVVCSEYQGSLIDLYSHHQTAHKSSKILFCLYCGLNFSIGASLRNHMIMAHNRTENMKLLECDICGRQMLLKTQMSVHMKNHKPPEFYCDQCSKIYHELSTLRLHQQTNHSREEGSKICSDCGKRFPNKSTFNRHYKLKHLNLKKFFCDICNEGFGMRDLLKKHALKHTNVGHLPCRYCDKKFKRKTALDYHICRDHTGEKPYCCPVAGCGYRAIDFANSSKHIKIVHKSNAKPVKVS